ncbi:Eight transmembrane protein EpsH, putative exosortase OS=Singulisphaera acidiphila (strain ATCC BAA-1392 / DSM 18658 / VKM B-2454 / MOB10) GN=Sinac_2489 PE=4 SV=1: Exosortase_EpsH [Gemmata massiliana]|uniref:Exosortase n=1 Tax=Gemmata massiliana TaxID=1210884 RepID=A0A6P2CRZ2_9BACT|nr:exosortase/archaeosortase family protein [Gemmata massiliana]VTR91377.1 Eight transmembrane protein EpsH, putative exosortase OS=Singulisphaera acidiphila (strain ATCC BAA-1392 / DSM 18658 / VKM B-2454 / MOB10) GN=Sinac_2489 PE=4 SV=1: Exosortase_EpsH [Gemmata massiliana]
MSSVSFASPTLPAPASASVKSRIAIWQGAALAAVLGWAYLPMLSVFADKWLNDPQYSHGLLVPFFSAFLLWRGWKSDALVLKPLPVLGCAILVAILAMRAVAGALLFYQLDAASLLLALVAVSLAVGGIPLAKFTAPAIAFLVFMVPLPYELERNVGSPLKVIATVCSTFLLQTLGLPAIRDGNLILIDDVRIGVVDACSGLKMMVTFAAFSVGAVLMMQRSRFEKLMVLLGIIPIAILTNVLRIAATGVSFANITDEGTRAFLHDGYGYMMIFIGLALLALELWVLKRLVVDPSRT